MVAHLAESGREHDDADEDREREEGLRRAVAQRLGLELAGELLGRLRGRDLDFHRHAPYSIAERARLSCS